MVDLNSLADNMETIWSSTFSTVSKKKKDLSNNKNFTIYMKFVNLIL